MKIALKDGQVLIKEADEKSILNYKKLGKDEVEQRTTDALRTGRHRAA